MKEIKYSVLILSFNQEEYISEAIESCLNQTLQPDEIIIADDCSTDHTREIINNFKISYPAIIKPILNKSNLGIYKNYNNAISYLSGDIFFGLGGDDYLLPNALKTVDAILKKEKVNINEISVCVISNHYLLKPNGSLNIWDNYRARKNNPFKEQLRSGLATRDYGISVSLIKQCLIPTDMGISADALRNLDIASKSELFLYTDEITTVHRIGSGVTAKTSMKEYCESSLKFRDLMNIERYPQMDESDLRFMKLMKIRDLMFSSKGISYVKYYFIYLYNIVLNFNNFSPNNSFKNNLRYCIPFYSDISFGIKQFLFRTLKKQK